MDLKIGNIKYSSDYMKKLGLNFTRLTLINQDKHGSIDTQKITTIVDYFLENGYNFFEVDNNSKNYLAQKILKKTVVDRYPRNDYIILNKLPTIILDDSYELDTILEKQLENTGVEYFDYYLIDIDSFSEERLLKEDSYKFLYEKKKEQKIRKIGILFSTRTKKLEQILEKYSKYIDVIEIPINYQDWDQKAINSKDYYELATKYDKEIIACDVFKNRRLITLEDDVAQIYGDKTSIEMALRFVLSLDDISMVSAEILDIPELIEAIEVVDNFEKLTQNEYQKIDKVNEQINRNNKIHCINCQLCDLTCPMDIPVSKFLTLYNDYNVAENETEKNFIKKYYQTYMATIKYRRASSCISCSQCMEACPQKIDIISNLNNLSRIFDF